MISETSAVCLSRDSELDRINSLAAGPGQLFVVSGPSGVGKGSLVNAIIARLPAIVKSVSATTRAPRPEEVDGVDYHFKSREQFVDDIAADQFFEYAEYNRNYYGTPCGPVKEQRAQGMDVVLEIEVKGAQIVRSIAPEAVLIFVCPPSMEALKSRLKLRGTNSPERITERLQIADAELSCLPIYDYAIVNDDFETAVDELRAVVLAHRCQVRA